MALYSGKNIYQIEYSEYEDPDLRNGTATYGAAVAFVCARSKRDAFDIMRINRVIFPKDISHPESCIYSAKLIVSDVLM